MRRAAWMLAAVVVTGAVRPAAAQSDPLPPSGGPPVARPVLAFDPNPSVSSLPPDYPSSKAQTEKLPPVLGAPVMGAPVRPSDRGPQNTGNVRVAGVDRGDVPGSSEPVTRPTPGHPGEAQSPVRRAAALGAPETAGNPIPAQAIETSVRPAYAPSATDPVNDLLTNRSGKGDDHGDPGERAAGKFGDKIGDTLNNALGSKGDTWFKSDHAFDGFISPVSNPFLFEDPRSLTEVRPIIMYQHIPSAQPDFKGGGTWFYGTQARVAFTDRLSFVLNKFGGDSINPGDTSPFSSRNGFAEIWLGPKYTFLRCEETGSVVAGGLQFQIPVGSGSTFQDTGTLSLVPYLSYAQNFGKDWSCGSFNAMVGTGYSISVNQERSDYYYLSGHVDMDVLNMHRFYPLMELNWLITTTNGNSTDIGSEGRDLFDFGGQAKGRGLLTAAFGGRFKICEAAQIGAAIEVPLIGPKDLFGYRFTVDFILRY
jgi:hypothetical protein